MSHRWLSSHAWVALILVAANAMAETENNDTPSNANPLALNAGSGGSIGYHKSPTTFDNFDWYVVTTTGDGTLTGTSVSSGIDIQLYLYRKVDNMEDPNSGGDYVGGGGTPTADTVSSRLRAGTYYIQVIDRGDSGSYSLMVSFTPAALTNDSESNDTPGVAVTLGPTSTTTGHLGYYSNAHGPDIYDWYKVTTPGDGRVTVTTRSSDGDLDLQVYLYRMVSDMSNGNSSGDYVGGGGSATDDTASDRVRAGTNFVQLIRRTGVGSYTMSVSFSAPSLANDQENNDTPSVARSMVLGTAVTGHMGYYSHALGNDRYDWYSVTTSGNGRLSMQATTSEGDLDLQVYIYRKVDDMHNCNSGGDYVGGGGALTSDTAVDLLRPGTYYVQLVRRTGIGSYTLTPTFTPAARPGDAEPNDTPNQALAATPDSVSTGHAGYYSNAEGYDTYDWYKIVVTTSRKLSFYSQVVEGDLDIQIYLYKTIDNMNNGNPGGEWSGCRGNQRYDTTEADVVAGTYYVQVIRRSGTGSYELANGNAGLTGVIVTDSNSPAALRRTKATNAAPLVPTYDARGRYLGSRSVGSTGWGGSAGVHFVRSPLSAKTLVRRVNGLRK